MNVFIYVLNIYDMHVMLFKIHKHIEYMYLIYSYIFNNIFCI